MKKLIAFPFFYFIFIILSTNVLAQDTPNGHGLYLAAGISRISTETIFDKQTSRFDFDDSDNAFNFRIGYQFNSWFGIEAAAYDLGEFQNNILNTTQELNLSSTDISLDLKGYGLSLVGTVPLNIFNLYGKFGAMRLQGEAQVLGLNLRANDASTQPFATVGGELKLGKVNFFAEYSKLFQDDIFEVNMATMGIKLGL